MNKIDSEKYASFARWYEETYKVDEDARFRYRTSSVEEIAFEAFKQGFINKNLIV